MLTNEVKVSGGQGLLGEFNTLSITRPQPNPVGLGLTQLSPEMEGFYVIVGLPSSEFGMMVGAGFTSLKDLAYFNESIIDQLLIRLSSKA